MNLFGFLVLLLDDRYIFGSVISRRTLGGGRKRVNKESSVVVSQAGALTDRRESERDRALNRWVVHGYHGSCCCIGRKRCRSL
jgi:hypothetical protein